MLLALPCVVLGQDSAPSLYQPAIDAGQQRSVKVYGASAGRVEGYASGILVSNDGLILTGSGVFLTGNQVRVTLPDGTTHIAKLLRQNRRLQLALLQVTAETPEYFDLESPSEARQGDWVLAISNAFKVADGSEPQGVSLGVISLATSLEAMRNSRDVAYAGDLVLIDAITSNPGAAGGAVVDLEGELVGMIGRVIESSETSTRLNYAVPTQLLKQFVDGKLDDLSTTAPTEVTDGGKPGELGIKVFKLGGKREPAYVDRVTRGSPAHEAGIRPDDLIISIDGEKVGTVADYEDRMNTIKAGTDAVVVVKRGARLLRLILTPVEK